MHGAKPLHVLFNKTDGYNRKYDSTKYLALFQSDEKHETNFSRMSYLIMLKSNISVNYSHKYKKIKINSGDSLSLEKAINM